MRALSLIFALLMPASALAAPADFVERLKAMGPQSLQVSRNLEPPTGRAQLVVEADGALRLTWGEGQAETFRYDPAEAPVDRRRDGWPDSPTDFVCEGSGDADRLVVACFWASDLMAAAIRPPAFTFSFEIRPDGIRAVRNWGRSEERVVFAPVGVQGARAPGVGPGAPAVMADALRQLEGELEGRLSGGSSGGGDWYASDLRVSEVRGLDFALERTVWPDRGGRSALVPARWSFDYQGPAGGDPQAIAWLVVMRREGQPETEFWCVGRPEKAELAVACRPGRKAWSGVEGKPAFRLEPYPRWQIHITEGPHSLFSSVGTSRLETRPYP